MKNRLYIMMLMLCMGLSSVYAQVIVTGTVSEVEAAIEAILQYVKNTLGYAVVPITRT